MESTKPARTAISSIGIRTKRRPCSSRKQSRLRFVMRRAVLWFLVCLILTGEASAQANTGTIKGHVRLDGKLPGNPIIRMGMDPMCSKMNAGKRILQEYVVATIDGSLANVFVRLQGHFPQTPLPAQPVMIDQHGCVYTRRVVGARAGQTIQIQICDKF